MNKKSIIYIITSVIIVFLVAVALHFVNKCEPEVIDIESDLPPAFIRQEYGIDIDSFYIVEGKIKPNTYISQVLSNLGAKKEQLALLNTLDSSIFDVRTIRTGNTYKAFYSFLSADSVHLQYWVYEKSLKDYFVFHFTDDAIHVEQGMKLIEKRLRKVNAEITSSLWNAAVDNNISTQLAMDLSDVYAWTIDFFGLQQGDKFMAIYDEHYIDSVFYCIGKIHAAQFITSGTDNYAFHFQQDSISGYFNEKGESLKKSFLKAPLSYSRISSGFTYARMHPVHRVVRPHTGVDYAAPMGTPVMSIGDGVVIEKGYNGGGGNTVRIRHNKVYTTAYLHLSKYGEGIKPGVRVKQGQVIGYVGSTGTSTGPHLDFRVWMNGKAINPLKMESPPAEPIHEDYRAEFDSIKVIYQEDLNLLINEINEEK